MHPHLSISTVTRLFCVIHLLFFLAVPIKAEAPDNLPASNLDRLSEAGGTPSIEMHYFYRTNCSFCAQQSVFMEGLAARFPRLVIHRYNLDETGILDLLLAKVAETGNVLGRIGVPITFVEKELFVGFIPATKEGMELAVLMADRKITDQYGPGTDTDRQNTENKIVLREGHSNGRIEVPFIGVIDAAGIPLALSALVIGSLDGLNVCSIGALILILSLVITMNSRKMIFFYGLLFLLTTATVYGGLMFVWYGLFNALVSRIRILEFLIGLVALAGGIWLFRRFSFFLKYGPGCKIAGNPLIERLSGRLRTLATVPAGKTARTLALPALLVVFATVITIVELPCSVALPLVFSALVGASGAGPAVSVAYIALYLFFYLLIELVIFTVAVVTKKIWYGPEAATVWVTGAAAFIMVATGAYYLFKVVSLWI